MGEENNKPDAPPEPQSGFPQKKIIYAIIAIAIAILAVVLIAKFSFNVDLFNPAYGEMGLVQRHTITNPYVTAGMVAPGSRPDLGDDSQLANVELQNESQKQQQLIQMLSEINKTVNDTAMAVIRKIG
jgi:hypothetical protein